MKCGALLAVVCSIAIAGPSQFIIDYDNNCFLKDGEPFQMISGSIHYFNVPEDLWEDRLVSMRNCGINTVQTYIEWRTLEPENNLFDFADRNNITRFFETAQKVGLLVNARIGPYICSERDMGGLPWWLMQVDSRMKLRTSDVTYMKYVTRYWQTLLPKLRPLLYSNGGPIILVQIENEYGSYSACDFVYTNALRDLAKRLLGEDVVYYTTDGDRDRYLRCGKIEGVFATVDFNSTRNVESSFAAQRRHQLRGPLVNSEYYTGWLDFWGQKHQTRSTAAIVGKLDEMLAMNASVNMYMFLGGTHFGFDNGANLKDTYQPCPTSYDYDALLTEAGDPTDKYFAIREVIRKYAPIPDARPAPKSKAALGDVVLRKTLDLGTTLYMLTILGNAQQSTHPVSFESLGHGYGLVAYRTTIPIRVFSPSLLKVPGLRDRGYVYVDDELRGILSREIGSYEMPIGARQNQTLTILVENQGRVCFGDGILDPKGILDAVQLGNHSLTNWDNVPLPDSSEGFDMLSNLRPFFDGVRSEMRERQCSQSLVGFGVYGGTFHIVNNTKQGLLDSYLQTDSWGKGFVFINGVNLGRYWANQGPQVTLYVPSVFLRFGLNSILVVELEAAPASLTISFVNTPIINGTVPQ